MVASLHENPEAFRTDELEEQAFNRSVNWSLLALDTLMGVGGLAALATGIVQEQDAVAGVGAAVAFHSGVMLSIDIWRSLSDASYYDAVRGFDPNK